MMSRVIWTQTTKSRLTHLSRHVVYVSAKFVILKIASSTHSLIMTIRTVRTKVTLLFNFVTFRSSTLLVSKCGVTYCLGWGGGERINFGDHQNFFVRFDSTLQDWFKHWLFIALKTHKNSQKPWSDWILTITSGVEDIINSNISSITSTSDTFKYQSPVTISPVYTSS